MRTTVLMLAIASVIAAPMTLAQSRNDTASGPPAAGAADAARPPAAGAASDRAARKKPHGAFGRAMADLTQALRDASLQQAQAGRSGAAAPGDPAGARATVDAAGARTSDGAVAATQAVP